MMKRMQVLGLITSSIDGDYYIIDNSSEINLFIFATVLMDNNEYDCANIITPYIFKNKEKKQKLFVDKKSHFGEVLSKLIQKNEIQDESNFINRENMVNAFLNEIQKDFYDEEYLKVIYSLIKDRVCENVSKLCSVYPREYLEKIVREGRRQDYLPSLNIELTGQEEEGYLYDEENGKWYQFNLVTKAKTILKEDKMVKKKRLF